MCIYLQVTHLFTVCAYVHHSPSDKFQNYLPPNSIFVNCSTIHRSRQARTHSGILDASLFHISYLMRSQVTRILLYKCLLHFYTAPVPVPSFLLAMCQQAPLPYRKQYLAACPPSLTTYICTIPARYVFLIKTKRIRADRECGWCWEPRGTQVINQEVTLQVLSFGESWCSGQYSAFSIKYLKGPWIWIVVAH